MGKETKVNAEKSGTGSLDGLARRLGDLEESLTVVAGELGVSGVPNFKRLDPDTVYREAMRRAQDSVAPLREAVAKAQRQFDELAVAQSQLRRDIAAGRERYAGVENLAALDDRLAALTARLEATLLPFDRSDAKLQELHEKIERLALRLDTVWERIDAETRERRDARPEEAAQAAQAAMTQRLAAAELRLEKIANMLAARDTGASAPQIAALEARLDKIAGAQAARESAASAAQSLALEERLAGLRLELLAQLDRRTAAPASDAIDDAARKEAIADEVARQLATLIREAASPVTPLLSEATADKAVDANPLVMGATERAIVRLTHRLERLEEWQQANSDDGKQGRGLMGRLFQS